MKEHNTSSLKRVVIAYAFSLLFFASAPMAMAADSASSAGGIFTLDSGKFFSGQPADNTSSMGIVVQGMRREIEEKGFATVYIQFSSNSAAILPESQPQLASIHMLLKEDGSLNLQIVGHTDSMGDAAYNRQLSQKRAESVQQALVALGIEAGRLTAEGMGEEKPVADNKTSEGRARNRRVELIKAN